MRLAHASCSLNTYASTPKKDCHRVAVLAWLQPDLPVPLTLQRSVEDDELLAGNVPQPPDWLRSWRATVSPASWRAAEKHNKTEHFIRQARDRIVDRESIVKMARLLREYIRNGEERHVAAGQEYHSRFRRP